MARKYKTPHFPDSPTGLFLLIDDTGIEDGPYRIADFARNGDDNEWVAQTDGRALFLRIVRQRRDLIWTKSGDGQVHRFRMHALMPGDLAA